MSRRYPTRVRKPVERWTPPVDAPVHDYADSEWASDMEMETSDEEEAGSDNSIHEFVAEGGEESDKEPSASEVSEPDESLTEESSEDEWKPEDNEEEETATPGTDDEETDDLMDVEDTGDTPAIENCLKQ